jgi:diamine N-acetyltransferase
MTPDVASHRAFTLVPAEPRDAAELAAFAERTFRETFGGFNTPENMDAFCARTYGEAMQRRELDDPLWHTVLVRAEDELIGYLQVRRGSAPDCVTGPDPVELQRIYVDAGWHGQGVAQALIAEALDIARQVGGRTMHLGVWENNHRALAFYEKLGFRRVGEREFLLGTAVDRDYILARPI